MARKPVPNDFMVAWLPATVGPCLITRHQDGATLGVVKLADTGIRQKLFTKPHLMQTGVL